MTHRRPTTPPGHLPSTPQPPPRRTSRAGSNLPVAIGVGVSLGILALGTLLFWRQGFLVLIIIFVLGSIWEMRTTLHQARGIAISWIPLGIGVAATLVAVWPWGHEAQVVGIALTVLACMFWRLSGGAAGFVADVTASIFLVVYLGLFATFGTLMLSPEDGGQRVLTFLIMVVASDVGGYAAGVLFGRHPMAPTISPKKSWEGFAGSVVLAMAGGALTFWLMFDAAWWQGLITGAVIAVVATLGDLSESLIKRDLGVKDMGTLLPGHGGIMDRMDSLLPSAVVTWLLLTAFIPVAG